MSYSGNSKEQVVYNAVTNDQFSVLNDRITSEKTFLMSLVNTEATNRTSADTNLNNLINVEKVNREESVAGEASSRTAGDALLDGRISTEKSFLMARIADESASRSSAINAEKLARELADETNNSLRISGDATNDARITSEKQFLMNLINTEASNRTAGDATLTGLVNQEVVNREDAVASEVANRIAGDNTLNTRISDEKTFLIGLNNAVSSRVSSLESGLTQQIATQVSGQAYDALQRSLIQEAVASLGDADSVIYTKIAQKASILMENQFKSVFNLFVADFFNSYSLGANGVVFNASRYELNNEAPVNQDPKLSTA